MTTISIRERGKITLSRSEFSACSQKSAFWELVGKGILSLSFDASRQPVLSAAGFLGRARFDSVEIDIAEKVPGSVEALLEHATEGIFRSVNAKGVTTESDSMIRLIVRVFLEALQTEVARGVQKRYISRKAESSLVAGRLDMTRTVALRARGLRHKVAFHRQVLTSDTPFNRMMLAAIAEVERLYELGLISVAELVRARGMSLIFSEARSRETMLLQRSRVVDSATKLAERETEPSRRQLLEMAAIILLRQSFEGAHATGRSIQHTWFFSLDRLFEKAVRRLAARFAKPLAAIVRDGNRHPRPIAPSQGRFEAHPDLLIEFANAVVAVGDVKFKQWDSSEVPSTDDLYQLLAHASAFSSSVAFFVYPGEDWDLIDLGDCTTGARVFAFRVSMRELSRDVGRVVDLIASLCSPFAPTPVVVG